MSAEEQAEDMFSLKDQRLWPAVMLAGLVAVLYAQVLKRLVAQWWDDPNYAHGFIVPVFVGYVLWRERDRWQNMPLKPSNLGLLVMIGAVGLLAVGTLGAELFVTRFSLLLLLTGIVLYLAGWEMLQTLRFPLAYLVLMIPLPTLVYNRVTFPLQLAASQFAAGCLDILRVPVLREGNLLVLSNYTLEVAEACSGIRSLISLLALAIAYGYLAERRFWLRIVVVFLMFPIAVASNGLRVVGTGLLTYFFGPQLAEGFFHFFSGWLIFLAASGLMLGTHGVLRRMVKPRFENTHV